MIGNDLVFLPLWGIHSAGRKNRFREKLFTPAEHNLIRKFGRSETEALLWSMKEAAYKIYFRQHPVTFYAPRQFQCELHSFSANTAEGLVHFDLNYFATRSYIAENYLHTIALPQAEETQFGMVRTEVREYDKTAERLITDNRYADPLKVEKDSRGIPQLFLKNELTMHPLSISHDADKVAFAWI